MPEKNRKKRKHRGWDDLWIIEITIVHAETNMPSVQNGTAAKDLVSNLSDFHQVDFFVKIDNIEEPEIALSNGSLSDITLLHLSFCIYGLDYLYSILSVTSEHLVSAKNVTTLLMGWNDNWP